MTVLCLVELDGDAPADASLRALTFARTLASGGELAAVLFGVAGPELTQALAGYGVASAYVTGPELLAGYAPLA